jgi:hypothetical protein
MRMLRVTLVLARPSVVALLGMFTAVGMAAAGEPDDPLLLARALIVVAAFLLFAISVNDLADERLIGSTSPATHDAPSSSERPPVGR